MPNQQHDQGSEARRNKRARLLTPGFNLARHFLVLGGIALGGLALGGWLARLARLEDLWVIPAYLLLANLVEYLLHRWLMHRPLWPRTLYQNHTLGHHRAFHHDSMEIASWREIDLVMMPWFTIALFFVALAPLVVVVRAACGDGAAGLLLLTAVISFVTYEGMHALYHLPAAVLRRLGLDRNGLFQRLYRHHRHHHRLVRMRWVNFNISLPLSDSLFGTREPEAAWRREQERRRRRATGEGEREADPQDDHRIHPKAS